MFDTRPTTFKDKTSRYNYLNHLLSALIQSEPEALANLCNAAALLWEYSEGINWAGFYLRRKDELVLGPFHGKPACVHIPIGNGVCGTAAETRAAQVVPDVHQFPGHIACDSASNSEIVVPVLSEGEVVGVIDIDSPHFSTFDEEDRLGLEQFAGILSKYVDWTQL